MAASQRGSIEEKSRSARALIVESAGTWGHEGAPMEANAEAVLADFGADASGFTGRELLDEHVIMADLVLTATRDHRAQVISMGHSAGLRTFTLKEFTRLVNAIDPATLPPLEEGVVRRARAVTTIEQLDAIFSSTRTCGGTEDITNWGQLDLPGAWANRGIQLYGRNSVSGTYGYY